MERKYYLVEPNGKSMTAIKEWQRLSTEAWEKAEKITKEYGAKPELLKGNEIIHGLCFESDPGRAWKPVSNRKDCYAPDKRIKEGKIIAKQLNEIRFPSSRTFADLIGGGFLIITDDRHWSSVSFQNIADNYVISVPTPQKQEDEFIPPDAKLLKMSEYYAMKDAVEEKAK